MVNNRAVLLVKNADSDPEGLEWGLKFCTNKLPGGDAADAVPHFESQNVCIKLAICWFSHDLFGQFRKAEDLTNQGLHSNRVKMSRGRGAGQMAPSLLDSPLPRPLSPPICLKSGFIHFLHLPNSFNPDD